MVFSLTPGAASWATAARVDNPRNRVVRREVREFIFRGMIGWCGY
jgi:hypothetical protein